MTLEQRYDPHDTLSSIVDRRHAPRRRGTVGRLRRPGAGDQDHDHRVDHHHDAPAVGDDRHDDTANPALTRPVGDAIRIREATTQTSQIDPAEESRLRFVFDDAVVSFCLAARPTIGDIAHRFAKLPRRRYGALVAIDVTLGSRPGQSDHDTSGRREPDARPWPEAPHASDLDPRPWRRVAVEIE
jgi:hypothetical protein